MFCFLRNTEKVWIGRRKPILSKKNMVKWLRFAKLHLNKLQDLWNNVLCTDKHKDNFFACNVQRHV